MTIKNKSVFITGANRGIGLEVCKKFALEYKYKVYMGSRVLKNAVNIIEELDSPKNIVPVEIDVSDEKSVKNAYDNFLKIKDNDEKLYLFINNAACGLDWVANKSYYKSLEIPTEILESIYRTNVFGAIWTTKYFLPVMEKNSRIVNVASGSGEFWDANALKDFQVGYAPSKSALIMTTKKLAMAVKDKGIYINAVCPNWCKTEKGGENAKYSAAHGAESIIKACFLNKENNIPTGFYFRDGLRIPIDVKPYTFEFLKISIIYAYKKLLKWIFKKS